MHKIELCFNGVSMPMTILIIKDNVADCWMDQSELVFNKVTL